MVAFQIFPFWTMDMDWVYYMEDVSEWAGDVMKAKKSLWLARTIFIKSPQNSGANIDLSINDILGVNNGHCRAKVALSIEYFLKIVFWGYLCISVELLNATAANK